MGNGEREAVERQAFEAWMAEQFGRSALERNSDDTYHAIDAGLCWLAWQARAASQAGAPGTFTRDLQSEPGTFDATRAQSSKAVPLWKHCDNCYSPGLCAHSRVCGKAAPSTAQSAAEGETCRTCKGSGDATTMTQCHGPDDYEVTVECPECGGTGATDAAPGIAPEEDFADHVAPMQITGRGVAIARHAAAPPSQWDDDALPNTLENGIVPRALLREPVRPPDPDAREWVNRLAGQYAMRQIAMLRDDRPAVDAANKWIGLIAQECVYEILQAIIMEEK